MAKGNGWPIGAQLHRYSSRGRGGLLWTRSYAKVENAVRKACILILIDGEVGDVIAIYDKHTGLELVTIRMTAKRQMSLVWTSEFRPASDAVTEKEKHDATVVDALTASIRKEGVKLH